MKLKELSKEELLEQYCFSCIECNHAESSDEDCYSENMRQQNELLRRLARAEELEKLVENLKCCGNCQYWPLPECADHCPTSNGICEGWLFDNLTAAERKAKWTPNGMGGRDE